MVMTSLELPRRNLSFSLLCNPRVLRHSLFMANSFINRRIEVSAQRFSGPLFLSALTCYGVVVTTTQSHNLHEYRPGST